MIRIFGAGDTVFTSNGDVVVEPSKAKVHKEDNGDFYLDFECGIEYADYVTGGRIIVAPTPQGEQAFRISNVTKTRKKCSTRAYHVWYDCKNVVVYYPFVTAHGGNTWLTDILDDYCIPSNPLTDLDQSDTFSNTRAYSGGVCTSLFDFLAWFISKWGGHYVRNNWSMQIKTSIGQDRGITIEYGKNLKDITKVEDWTDVCTVVLPVGKNGTRLSTNPPVRASSDQYDDPYCKVVTFNQEGVGDEQLTTDLRYKADDYLASHHVPKISYSVKANIDYISDIGDTIRVRDTVLGVDVMTTVHSYDYDCLLDKYVGLTFGNFIPTAKGMANTLNAVAKNAELGIIGDNKMLKFNNDNTVSWATMSPV